MEYYGIRYAPIEIIPHLKDPCIFPPNLTYTHKIIIWFHEINLNLHI